VIKVRVLKNRKETIRNEEGWNIADVLEIVAKSLVADNLAYRFSKPFWNINSPNDGGINIRYKKIWRKGNYIFAMQTTYRPAFTFAIWQKQRGNDSFEIAVQVYNFHASYDTRQLGDWQFYTKGQERILTKYRWDCLGDLSFLADRQNAPVSATEVADIILSVLYDKALHDWSPSDFSVTKWLFLGGFVDIHIPPHTVPHSKEEEITPPQDWLVSAVATIKSHMLSFARRVREVENQ